MKNQTVWPEEVKALFRQVPDAANCDPQLQVRLHYHINRLLLIGTPSEEIRAELALMVNALEGTRNA